MKRVFLFAMSLLVLAGCGESENSGVPEGGFSVGDLCMHKGRQAIVVSVNIDRKSGLLMSVEETRCNWDDASLWAESLGSGWRLPTRQELQAIYNVRDRLNASLSEYGMAVLKADYYWSSEEESGDYAWYVRMGDGYTGYYYKNGSNESFVSFVRAVSAF